MNEHHPTPGAGVTGDLLETLGQDDRVVTARRLPVDTPPTDAQINELRQRISDYLLDHNIKPAKLAKQTRSGVSTVVEWLGDNYSGDNAKYARRFERWLDEQNKAGSHAKATGFVSTGVCDRMFTVFRRTKLAGGVGIIHGPAGIGKTTVAEAATEFFNPNAVYIHCTSTLTTQSGFLRRLARECKVSPTGTMAMIEERIIDDLTGSETLLIIDEAHLLNWKTLLCLRSIHKVAKAPLVLVGTELIEELIDDRRGDSGQWSRLVDYRYNIQRDHIDAGRPLYTVDEVIAFVENMKLRLTDEGAELATDFVNIRGWGAFGALEKLLDKADAVRRTVRTLKADAIDTRHIMEALGVARGKSEADAMRSRTGAKPAKKARVA